jgi:hypothetical protein
MRNISAEIKHTVYISYYELFAENRTVHVMLWEKVVGPNRRQTGIEKSICCCHAG